MRSARENARRIRGGGNLVLIGGVTLGLGFLAQVVSAFVGSTPQQLANTILITDIDIFLSFVCAGLGAYLAFSGLANEVEAGAVAVAPAPREEGPTSTTRPGVPVEEYIRVVKANQRTGRRDAFAFITFGAVWLVLSPLAPDFYRFAFYMAAIASIALGLLYLAWERIDGRGR